MNGYVGQSPLRSQKPEDTMLRECARNLKRECADLVVGMAVFTEQISQSALRYKKWCSINYLSPNEWEDNTLLKSSDR
jgi:hypothetical protein